VRQVFLRKVRYLDEKTRRDLVILTNHLDIPALIIWGFPWIGAVGALIFLAGLHSIGSEVYEAADLDGGTLFQKFVHIKFPLIMTQGPIEPGVIDYLIY